MKKGILIILLSMVFQPVLWAQDKGITDSKFHIQTKLTNQLLWRSRPTTKVAAIVPSVDYSTHGFTAGVWAAYSLDNSYKEIDFYVGYQWKGIELWVYDYYNPALGTQVNFGNFKLGETEHLFEANAIVRPFSSLGLRLRAALMFAGSDVKTSIVAGTGAIKYEQNYTSYFEVGYDYKIGSITLSPEIGLTPAKGVFADKFSVFNYSLNLAKDLKINEHLSLPTTYTLAYNATLKQVFFSACLIIKL